jgi:BirA family biotin operon repressor/biotin-[acetyl-CoA-carboxylase] ligase
LLKGEAEVLSEWKELNVTLGKRVSISGPREVFEGLAQEIDPEGRLIVRLDDGDLRQVAAGDVTILKKA